MKKNIYEPSREITVTHEADLVVAGGGTAGVACAICAARLGLSVIMVENTAQPGGMVTQVTQWTGDIDNKGGFTREFFEYLFNQGIMERPYYNHYLVTPYMDELIKNAGVRPLYFCRVVNALAKDGELQGVVVESKQGRHAILAKIVVDATGDGDVAVSAGAEFEYGRATDGAVQSVSLTHSIQNFLPFRVNLRGEILPQIKQIAPDYELPYDHGNLQHLTKTKSGLLVGISHVTGCNPLNAESLSDAVIELRRQSREFFELLCRTEQFPDLEFGPFGALPGVRESRRIVCDAKVTVSDIDSGKSYADGLFTVDHCIDIHRCLPDEPAIVKRELNPYKIPYGALLPKGLSRLLVIGRCIGGEHEALASYRLIADCFAMGEAAALAAAQSLRTNQSLRSIEIKELIGKMTDLGYQT
ncbi:MAG: FAD-dependent oxidoreductase [Lentisphaerae bacterium]|nr:FAD-dependent oxidoreductase [Lentisphaerota bacterium]